MQKRSVQTVRAGRQDAARFAYGKNRRYVLSWMRRITCRRQAARGENKSGSAAKYGRAVKKIETEAMMINGELINSVFGGYQRKISNVIYFCMALPNA